MDSNYSNEKNVQILIALMKKHGVRKVIVSPGATNVTFVASIQSDSYFEIYSSVDERSAAYMACGMAAESGEPVALSCTGATASRNYVSGLTEAYYRKLPVLAITSTQPLGRIGHYFPQVVDRTNSLNDTTNLSVQIPVVHDEEEEWSCETMVNNALLELRRYGSGPVHINLTTAYGGISFNVKNLPDVRMIKRFTYTNNLPNIVVNKVAIFVGAHAQWSQNLTMVVDEFCEKYNAVVICDQTSNYRGKYRVLGSLVTFQDRKQQCRNIDIMIHIGYVSGAYMELQPKEVWRVNSDGEIRDTFKKLHYVFEMDEFTFFKRYVGLKTEKQNTIFYKEWQDERNNLLNKIPNLPFSNIWIAQNMVHMLPKESVLHLGILNSLRAWNFVETDESIRVYCNTGGFGIDGCVSSLIGASLASPNKLFFGVVGDLAFFYDMNSIGNRYVGNNIRLLVINNGIGTEFKNYNHIGSQFGKETDLFIAAGGHFGEQSRKIIRDYATDLGFAYLSASTKDEFLSNIKEFIDPIIGGCPMIFEVFTNSEYESEALQLINTIDDIGSSSYKNIKKLVKNVIGDRGVDTIKKLIKG